MDKTNNIYWEIEVMRGPEHCRIAICRVNEPEALAAIVESLVKLRENCPVEIAVLRRTEI